MGVGCGYLLASTALACTSFVGRRFILCGVIEHACRQMFDLLLYFLIGILCIAKLSRPECAVFRTVTFCGMFSVWTSRFVNGGGLVVVGLWDASAAGPVFVLLFILSLEFFAGSCSGIRHSIFVRRYAKPSTPHFLIVSTCQELSDNIASSLRSDRCYSLYKPIPDKCKQKCEWVSGLGTCSLPLLWRVPLLWVGGLVVVGLWDASAAGPRMFRCLAFIGLLCGMLPPEGS